MSWPSGRPAGTLTAYPLDTGSYDWAVERGLFKPKREEHHAAAAFIGGFSSAAQEHYHYSEPEPARE